MRYVISWQLMFALLLLMQAGLVYADKLSEVSEDFLEYLGNLEGTNENWTDFATKAAAPVIQAGNSSASSSKNSAGSKAAALVQVSKMGASSSATSLTNQTNHAATQSASKVER